jgi:hypothetical protein
MTTTNVVRSIPKKYKKHLITISFSHGAVVKQNHFVVRICAFDLTFRSPFSSTIKRVFKYTVLHNKIRAFSSI